MQAGIHIVLAQVELAYMGIGIVIQKYSHVIMHPALGASFSAPDMPYIRIVYSESRYSLFLLRVFDLRL